jgi:GAF domain-containing protein
MALTSRSRAHNLPARRVPARRLPARGERCLALLADMCTADDLRALEIAAAGICALLAADSCTIIVENSDAEPLVFEHLVGDAPVHQRIFRSSPIVQRVLHEQRTLSYDAPTPSSRTALIDERALLAAPLRLRDTLIGVIGLTRRQPRSWRHADICVAEAVAVQLAQQIERTRMAAVIEQRTQELAVICETTTAVSAASCISAMTSAARWKSWCATGWIRTTAASA